MRSAALFNLKSETLDLISDMENFVYLSEAKIPPCVLRITHSSHRTKEEILGEFEWIEFLAENGVSVIRPIYSINGMLVEVIDVGKTHFLVTAFLKIPGMTILDANECTPGIYQQWGQTLGKMHGLAKLFIPQNPAHKRSEWFMEDGVKNADKYIPTQTYILEKYKRLISDLGDLPKDQNSYGLIHGDLSDVNFFVHDHKITVFDFDDCTYHWFVHDIAVILYDCLDWLPHGEMTHEAFVRFFWKNFYQGYCRENDLDSFWMDQLPKFLKLREMNLYVVLHKKWDLNDLQGRRQIYLDKLKHNIQNDIFFLDSSSLGWMQL